MLHMEEPMSEAVVYSTPTCVQLGIPMTECSNSMYPMRDHRLEHDTYSLPNFIESRYPSSMMGPYPRVIPLSGPLGFYDFEPSFIRRRNERERERVRCVNEGYARLRERLPSDNPEKRLSKVETLRMAIKYIKHLQGVLSTEEHKENEETEDYLTKKVQKHK
ncbi:achaete-scute homolog 5-like [Anneissia japonica]|uniref:achaete-scute homolog 5-like n=1 Tax=Anneissia japonica TaxID=1529436 RepID=UPI001425AD59|nr:achaete-scute homolog 5-like [Anneissia japonica]